VGSLATVVVASVPVADTHCTQELPLKMPVAVLAVLHVISQASAMLANTGQISLRS
jgi:hypothetical protein